MLRGVLVRRVVAATDVAAEAAKAQVHPRVAHLQAFLATARTRLVRLHRVEVRTFHRCLLGYTKLAGARGGPCPGSAAIRCVMRGSSTRKRRTRSSAFWSAFVTRSCWRRCSSHDSTWKVSTKRPGFATSSNTPQEYAPSRYLSGAMRATASRKGSRSLGSMRYSMVTR